MPLDSGNGGAMDAIADTGMVGGAAALAVLTAESGVMSEASAGVVGAVTAVILRAVLALLPDLIAYCRARLALARAQTEDELDDITGEHRQGGPDE